MYFIVESQAVDAELSSFQMIWEKFEVLTLKIGFTAKVRFLGFFSGSTVLEKSRVSRLLTKKKSLLLHYKLYPDPKEVFVRNANQTTTVCPNYKYWETLRTSKKKEREKERKEVMFYSTSHPQFQSTVQGKPLWTPGLTGPAFRTDKQVLHQEQGAQH